MINKIKSLYMPKNYHFACPTQHALLIAMLDHFEIIKLLQSIIHHWKDTSWYQLYCCMLISFNFRAP